MEPRFPRFLQGVLGDPSAGCESTLGSSVAQAFAGHQRVAGGVLARRHGATAFGAQTADFQRSVAAGDHKRVNADNELCSERATRIFKPSHHSARVAWVSLLLERSGTITAPLLCTSIGMSTKLNASTPAVDSAARMRSRNNTQRTFLGSR